MTFKISICVYAQPRMPGSGQLLLVHTGPTDNLSTTILNSSPDLRDLRIVKAQQLGFATGIPMAPWPAPPPNQDAKMADVQPSTSASTQLSTSTSSSLPAEADTTGTSSLTMPVVSGTSTMTEGGSAVRLNPDHAKQQEMEVAVKDGSDANRALKTGNEKTKEATGEGSGATSTTR